MRQSPTAPCSSYAQGLTMNDAAHDKLLELGRCRRSRIAGSSDGRRHLASVRLYETAKVDGSWSGQRETSVCDWHWGTAPECYNFRQHMMRRPRQSDRLRRNQS